MLFWYFTKRIDTTVPQIGTGSVAPVRSFLSFGILWQNFLPTRSPLHCCHHYCQEAENQRLIELTYGMRPTIKFVFHFPPPVLFHSSTMAIYSQFIDQTSCNRCGSPSHALKLNKLEVLLESQKINRWINHRFCWSWLLTSVRWLILHFYHAGFQKVVPNSWSIKAKEAQNRHLIDNTIVSMVWLTQRLRSIDHETWVTRL